MDLFSALSVQNASDFFTVTVFGPGNVIVRSLELIGARTKSEAVHMSRNILLEYLEQGHKAGGAELRGKGIIHCIYREAGTHTLKESNRGDFKPKLL